MAGTLAGPALFSCTIQGKGKKENLLERKGVVVRGGGSSERGIHAQKGEGREEEESLLLSKKQRVRHGTTRIWGGKAKGKKANHMITKGDVREVLGQEGPRQGTPWKILPFAKKKGSKSGRRSIEESQGGIVPSRQ